MPPVSVLWGLRPDRSRVDRRPRDRNADASTLTSRGSADAVPERSNPSDPYEG